MLYLFFLIIFVIVDQISKALAVMYLSTDSIKIFDWFYLKEVNNSGAAFSFLSGISWAPILFISLTCVALLAIAIYFIFFKKESKWLNMSLIFIASGAIGNLIDRLIMLIDSSQLDGVRDFIYVTWFANFNVADIFVTVGGIMFAIYLLFLGEDSVFKGKKQ